MQIFATIQFEEGDAPLDANEAAQNILTALGGDDTDFCTVSFQVVPTPPGMAGTPPQSSLPTEPPPEA